MFRTRIYVMRWLVMLFVTAALAAPVQAAKPDHAGGPGHKGGGKHAVEQPGHAGKPGKGGDHGGGHSGGSRGDIEVFFDTGHRDIIRDYYRNQFSAGHCPPGLAKKNNGCLPPGQAKKWRVGHPLPHDVIYHDLPHDLVVRLGHDNPAYKLVRVGADILKIGVGTGLVVEAVEDLGGLF